jgi:hypothetical protein
MCDTVCLSSFIYDWEDTEYTIETKIVYLEIKLFFTFDLGNNKYLFNKN